MSGFIEGDRSIAVTFTGCVGSDEIDLTLCFELCRETVWIVVKGVIWRDIFNIGG